MGYRTDFAGEFSLNRPLELEHKAILEAFAAERHEGEIFPSIWCHWEPTKDGTAIHCQTEEVTFYNYREWLEYIVVNFLLGWGYHIAGEVLFQGEDITDRGLLHCNDERIWIEELR